MEICAPIMEIGAQYNTRKRAPRSSGGVRSAAACRSFDRVKVYNYDASRQAFPGTAPA
jgi:hypothetical protein